MHQPKLRHEIVKVFVASVDVWLSTDLHQPVKVMNVYVDEHPVEPCENLFVDRSECFGKGNIILHRKNGLIIDLTLYPIHQMGYVLVSWKFGWPFELLSVLPKVLEFGTARHRWAAGVGTFLANGPVDQVDSVEKVYHVNGQPIVEILVWWKFYNLTKVHAGVQRRLSLLVQ